MLRHVVVFRWTDDASDEAKAAVPAALATLPAQIPEILAYRFGPDAGIDDGNWDFAVTADLADEAAYATYRDHPAHRAVIVETVRPIIAERAAMQVLLEG